MGDKFYKLLVELIRRTNPVTTVTCTVNSVDEGKYTIECDPIDGGATFHDVRLTAIIDNGSKGLVVIPKVGSTVQISTIQNNDNYRYVSKFSDIAKVLIECDNGQKFLINKTSGEMHLNGDSYAGLVKIAPLVSRLNTIENTLNGIIAWSSSHVHTGGTISGSTGPAVGYVGSPGSTTQSALENTKVKHG